MHLSEQWAKGLVELNGSKDELEGIKAKLEDTKVDLLKEKRVAAEGKASLKAELA